MMARVQRGAELAASVLILVTFLWVGDLLTAVYGLTGIVVTQLALVLAPTVAYSAATGAVARDLCLRRASGPLLLEAVVFGLALSIITSHLAIFQERWLHPGPVEVEAMNRLMGLVSERPAWAVLALVAAPAIAEEALFRGLVLGRLRRHFGAGVAVAISAASFALVHRSFSRFLAPLVLGIVLGIVGLRGASIAPAIALHFTYNLAILGFSMDWVREPQDPWWLVAALGVAGALLSRRARDASA